MTTTHHDTFTIERTYPHPVERVWAAFADPEIKRRWFGGDEFEMVEVSEDFRVGGIGVNDGRLGGVLSRYRSCYTDIVEYERIVYTYDMWSDDRHASTSVATAAFERADGGTRLIYVEQGAYFDGVHGEGADAAAGRAGGTTELLGRIEDVLDEME